jgi:hypothetical protein
MECSRRSSIPDRVCQQMLRNTEPGVHETRDLQLLVLARIEADVQALHTSTRPWAGADLRHGHM